MSTSPASSHASSRRSFAARTVLMLGASALSVAAMASCLDDIHDALPPGTDPQPQGMGGSGGGGGTGGGGTGGTMMSEGGAPVSNLNCTAACCPSDTDPTSAQCYVSGQKGPGAECLATRDNTGQKHWMSRSIGGRSFLPLVNDMAASYGFTLQRSNPPFMSCGFGASTGGFIQLIDLDRSDPDITKHVSHAGYANWIDAADMTDVITNGYCMLDFMWSDPTQGAPAIHIKPSTSHRVAKDFTADEVRGDLNKINADGNSVDGIFYMDDDTGYSHSYSGNFNVAFFQAADTLFVLTVHETELYSLYNDPTHPNCAGRYRFDALDKGTGCSFATDATQPSNILVGCALDDTTQDTETLKANIDTLVSTTIANLKNGSRTCSPGMGQTLAVGYYLIEELDQRWLPITRQSFLVNMYGQQKSIDEMWVTADDLTFSHHDRWKNGERPKGDWCSKTNGPATADCADAFRNVVVGAGAASLIKDSTTTTCSTTATTVHM